MFNSQYLTIGIGNRNIKLVYGCCKKSVISAAGYSIVPVPGLSVADGRLVSVPDLANAIGQEIAKKSWRPKGLIFSVSGAGVITRDIRLPRSTEAEVGQILHFDAAQYLPIDLSEYIYDYKVLEDVEGRDDPQTRVLLAAIPERNADEFMALGQALDIGVAAIDVQPNCIAKMVQNGQIAWRDKDAPVGEAPLVFAVVDVGWQSTKVSLFARGILQFSRALPYGVNEIEAAASGAGSTGSRPDLTGELSDQAVEAVQAVVERMAFDIMRLFDFYRSNNVIRGVSRIYLCGGGSLVSGLSARMHEAINIPADVIGKTVPLENIVYEQKNDRDGFFNAAPALISELGALFR
ncbi:MAG: pilus assembly protein PilM [Solirubrobacterales bacterium]